MRRFTVSALTLTSLFSLLILLLRAQPHTSDLAPINPPDGCPAPCFLGIQPGITTDQQAYALLYASSWTQDLLFRGEYATHPMTWKWSSAAPPIFRPQPRFHDGALGIEGGIVQYIELRTSVSLGETRLAWGAPEWYGSLITTGGPIGGPRPPRPFFFVYSDMVLHAPTECSRLEQMWWSDTTIIIGNPAAWLKRYVPPAAPKQGQSFRHFVADASRGYC